DRWDSSVGVSRHPGSEADAAQILPRGARSTGRARWIPGDRALWRFFFSAAGRRCREPGPGVCAEVKTSSKNAPPAVISDEEFPFPDEDLRSLGIPDEEPVIHRHFLVEDPPPADPPDLPRRRSHASPTTFSGKFVRSLSDHSVTVLKPHYP